MEKILLIETSTSLCSVALAIDGEIKAYRESTMPREHASATAPFIKAVLDECGIKAADCDAVCLSKGPGSYTSLRVGASTSKGICFGAGIPLLSAGTLDILVNQALVEGLVPEGCKYIVPMIDARRMEVYSAVFTPDGRQQSETQPEIVTGESYSDLLAQGPVLFVGDGAGKCADVIKNGNAYFAQCCPKASAMASLASRAYKEKKFEDIAYFEPFYLKEFVATVSKKNLF